MLGTLLLLVTVFLFAWALTGSMRRYAIARGLLDVPNVRSSHAVPTPRGGGIAIVLATLTALPVIGALGVLPWAHVAGLEGSGALVAAIGFADDHRDVPAHWRLTGHFIAAIWVLAWIGGLPPISVASAHVEPGWIGQAAAALYVVWLLNLTNFMDGIDGIAGLEAVTVCGSGAVLYLIATPRAAMWPVPLVLAAATLGFLVWNWPPAKIFMGDAGSGFLGLMFAALSVQAARIAPDLFWSWMILLGVFVVDATVTLLRRLIRRENLYEGHRSHAYQHAARRWAAHGPVTLAVAAINVFWLFPVAWLVSRGSLESLLGVAIAYAPLLAVALWLGAGKPRRAAVDPIQPILQ